MSRAAERLVELIRATPPDANAIAEHLDGLPFSERMAAIAGVGGPELQRRLYAATVGRPRVTLDDLVRADAPPLREFIFEGKNSLPVFTRFQKRFCRPPGTNGDPELWGYNHAAVGRLVGPGYFVVHPEWPGGVAIDYRRVPNEQPPGWPPVQRNDVGVSRLVYMDMVDLLRRVAKDVFIGSAHRDARELDNYFILCRTP
jgi:hypothetical protein